MRALLLPLIAFAAALLPAPVLADVTATYTSGSAKLVVEADDSGDWRFELSGGMPLALIERGGVAYFIITDRDNKVSVTRADAFVMAMIPQAGPPPEMPEFKLEAMQPESFAGYSGTVWRLSPTGDVPLDVLLSPDPALAPIGDVFRDFVGVFGERLATMPGIGGFADYVVQLFAKGTVIRASLGGERPESVLELASVTTGQIDPARFVLPGPVISAEEAVAKFTP